MIYRWRQKLLSSNLSMFSEACFVEFLQEDDHGWRVPTCSVNPFNMDHHFSPTTSVILLFTLFVLSFFIYLYMQACFLNSSKRVAMAEESQLAFIPLYFSSTSVIFICLLCSLILYHFLQVIRRPQSNAFDFLHHSTIDSSSLDMPGLPYVLSLLSQSIMFTTLHVSDNLFHLVTAFWW